MCIRDRSIPESIPETNTSEADSEVPVTIKIANYAVLEKGYEEFWQNVKTGYESKYPNVTVEWVTAPYGEILNQVINMAGGGDKDVYKRQASGYFRPGNQA